MPRYAQFDSTQTAVTPVIAWYDTDFASYPALPPAADLYVCTPEEWAEHATGLWGINPTAANKTLVPYTPHPPTLTLAQQAAALIAGGLTITSTSTPALNGVYACDDAAQAKISRVYGLIQRANGAFPAGLTSMPWTDKSGAPHVFPTVAQFLALETAVGDFVLACELVIATNSGTLPPAAASIP